MLTRFIARVATQPQQQQQQQHCHCQSCAGNVWNVRVLLFLSLFNMMSFLRSLSLLFSQIFQLDFPPLCHHFMRVFPFWIICIMLIYSWFNIGACSRKWNDSQTVAKTNICPIMICLHPLCLYFQSLQSFSVFRLFFFLFYFTFYILCKFVNFRGKCERKWKRRLLFLGGIF